MTFSNFTAQNRFALASIHGFSLLEVLITMFVLAFGLLGVAKLQLNALKGVQNGHYVSIANNLTQIISNQILVNEQNLKSYQLAINQIINTDINCQSQECSSGELSSYHLGRWQQRLSSSLPSGKGEIRIADREAIITVRWDENKNGSTGLNCPKLSEKDLDCLIMKRTY
ncbi:type IV pilus modification protein PilV [Thalassotalea crassostreae]|uniref:type IV pilus modification protein PilV n=1 Tax=Thalassotalea crassostreae TaxID=1763536 RepID=UPI000838EE90|nr:type IV pilus modification protein PilV [Thalassotalea crassostreae]